MQTLSRPALATRLELGALWLRLTRSGGGVDAAAAPAGKRRRMLLLAARDGEHCAWCRTPLTHRSRDATVDHVRCRSHGGGNALENLVLACARCNHERSDAAAEVWLARRLAAGEPVDAGAVAAAIRRSLRHHRQLPGDGGRRLLEPPATVAP